MITGELCGAEALIRWQRPDGTLVPPMDFIPLAESSGHIGKITRYVFRQIVIDQPLIESIHPGLRISFNASGKDFHDQTLTETIIKAVRARQIEASSIEVEVTETVLLEEDKARKALLRLADAGIQIAMDDFGTGHSGLVELSRWPFTIIKIDRKFVRDMSVSEKDREILQASIRMAHQLNITVVAEGIENEHSYQVLQEYGCRVGQGYWISRPLPLDGFIDFIRGYEKLPAMPIGLLYMAQLDHIQWRKTIIDTAYFLFTSKEQRPLENIRGIPEMQHTRCKLGQWYYGQGKCLQGIDAYERLEQPHEELHDLGHQLLEVARGDCTSAELSALIQRLSEKSLLVLEALQELENHLHSRQHEPQPFIPSIEAAER